MKYKIVVFDEMYILSRLNIILNTAGCPLLKLCIQFPYFLYVTPRNWINVYRRIRINMERIFREA
jgi:hypothetical protein